MATRRAAFGPARSRPGEWAVELGVAAVASQTEGDMDGKVAWRVEIDLSTDPLWESDSIRTRALRLEPRPAPQPGWYAGDFHVHAEHSSLGDATMTRDVRLRVPARWRSRGAGLDFVTLSDYVTDTAWGEIGRHQADHPGKLIVRSSEIITYLGHANNHASLRYVDHRTGPVYERDTDGALTLRRAARPASDLWDGDPRGRRVHPDQPSRASFPRRCPGFDFLCRGCPWDYAAAETDYARVDAIEIATGPAGLKEDPQPGPNPFTPLAIQFWESAIDDGGLNRNRIAAVGSSDSHNAGRTPDPVTQSPIGQATTVVYADELSEPGIQRGVQARHTYVKPFGNDGPDLRFEADVPGLGRAARDHGRRRDAAPGVDFTARVMGAGPGAARPGAYTLFVLKDGLPLLSVPVTARRLLLPVPERRAWPLPAAGAARSPRSRRCRARSGSRATATRGRKARRRCSSRWCPAYAPCRCPTACTVPRWRSARARRPLRGVVLVDGRHSRRERRIPCGPPRSCGSTCARATRQRRRTRRTWRSRRERDGRAREADT